MKWNSKIFIQKLLQRFMPDAITSFGCNNFCLQKSSTVHRKNFWIFSLGIFILLVSSFGVVLGQDFDHDSPKFSSGFFPRIVGSNIISAHEGEFSFTFNITGNVEDIHHLYINVLKWNDSLQE